MTHYCYQPDDERDNRKVRNNIPCGAEIQPAVTGPDGRDRRAARQPVAARADLLEAPVRKNKVDRRRAGLAGDQLQEFVRRGVGRRLVRAHTKTVGNRLELLRLVADTPPRPPPPRLVHERAVRRGPQPDDSVVHTARELVREMRDPITRAKRRQCGYARWSVFHGAALRVGHKNPDIAVALFAAKAASVDPFAPEL